MYAFGLELPDPEGYFSLGYCLPFCPLLPLLPLLPASMPATASSMPDPTAACPDPDVRPTHA